jgi:hypothetical protein
MTRGGFRLQLVLWSVMAALQVTRLTISLAARIVWGVGEYSSLALLVLALTAIAWFLRVRRRDARFWDEDEAKRADWEHRGRAL